MKSGSDDASVEAAVVEAISRARQDPKALATALKGRLPHFKGKEFYPPSGNGKLALPSKEGKTAVNDALAYLAGSGVAAGPVSNETGGGMKLAAEDHAVDRGALGMIGHEGSDGSHAKDRLERYGKWTTKCGECLWFGREGTAAETIVEDLVVDDGVPDRGHRLCIFDPAYAVASAKIGPHKTFGTVVVIEFAGSFEDHPDSVAAVAPLPSPFPARSPPAPSNSRAHASTTLAAPRTFRSALLRDRLGPRRRRWRPPASRGARRSGSLGPATAVVTSSRGAL